MTTLWTIGHSTRSLDELVAALKGFQIDLLADIRRFPASRRHPHFAIDPLKRGLFQAGIRYEYLGDELGGFRKTTPDSPHVGLASSSFRGYADWTANSMFQKGIDRLLLLAREHRAAYMCAERPPASCHRRILSDFLAVVKGCEIVHILDPGMGKAHETTRNLRRAGDGFVYASPQRSLEGLGA
jgi:uncharacterized protein (DUF488 family)